MDAKSSPLFQYRVMGEDSQPLTAAQLKKLRADGVIQRDTLVRLVGADHWVMAERVPWLNEATALPVSKQPPAASPSLELPPPPHLGDLLSEEPTLAIQEEPVHEPQARRDMLKGVLSRAAARQSQEQRRASRTSKPVQYLAVAMALVVAFALGYLTGSYQTSEALIATGQPRESAGPTPPASEASNSDVPSTTAAPAASAPEVAKVTARLWKLGAKIGVDEEVADQPILTVSLHGATVKDAALEDIRVLKKLRSLKLNRTQVSDEGLGNLRGLSQLRTLEIEYCQAVTDAGLPPLAELHNLQQISFEGSKISSKGLECLARLMSVTSLNVSGTNVDDAGLTLLFRLTALECLKLGGTKVTDAGLAHLRGFSRLRELDLSGTQVTNTGLASLGGMTALRMLTLENSKTTLEGQLALKKALPELTIVH